MNEALLMDSVAKILAELRCSLGDAITVVLVGSAARNVQTEESDIDLLLLANERPVVPKSFPGFHIQTSSIAEFKRNLQNGEDFEAWCVRLGMLLFDGGHWASIVASEEAKLWPRWELKVSHGARRLFLAQALLEMGDEVAASEELLYTVGHIARGLLLKSGVFPLSRPELAEQLKKLGYPHVAAIHEQLRSTEVDPHVIGQARTYSKKLLCHLDRDVYAACSSEQRSRTRLKRERFPRAAPGK